MPGRARHDRLPAPGPGRGPLLALAGILCLIAGIRALGRRPLRFSLEALLGLLLLACGALLLTLGVSVQGYRALTRERAATRTVYRLAADKPLNLFRLRQRYALLAPLLDVEYGSATYAPAGRPARFEVRVSTSGLLIREIPLTP